MQSYLDLAKFLGSSLSDEKFISFIKSELGYLPICEDESKSMIDTKSKLEMGFSSIHKKKRALDDGSLIFTHFFIYPETKDLIKSLPLGLSFEDKKGEVLKKAGPPHESRSTYIEVLKKDYLIDHYFLDELKISINYEPEKRNILHLAVSLWKELGI